MWLCSWFVITLFFMVILVISFYGNYEIWGYFGFLVCILFFFILTGIQELLKRKI
jgi:uncharacterized membrane protein YhaH (DUF805 family)